MPLSDTPAFDVTFNGNLVAKAVPDGALTDAQIKALRPGARWPTSTLRIRGTDVIAALKKATDGLEDPVVLTVTYNGTVIAEGRVVVQVGYDEMGSDEPTDGGLGNPGPPRIIVGGVDVLAELAKGDGGQQTVRVVGRGWVDPQVEVEVARWTRFSDTTDAVAPGVKRTMSARRASSLTLQITPDSRQRARDAVAADDLARKAVKG